MCLGVEGTPRRAGVCASSVRRRSRQLLATDFDGDGRSDATVFRPGNGVWYSLFANGSGRGLQWGGASDVPAPGDYDGDGKSGPRRLSTIVWAMALPVRSSANNTQSDHYPVGQRLETVPVPADYDGDGIDDVAVYRPSNGTWYLRFSSNGTAGAAAWGDSAGHSGAGRLRRGRHGRHRGLPSIDGNLVPAILQHGRLRSRSRGETRRTFRSPAISMATALSTLRSTDRPRGRGTCGTRALARAACSSSATARTSQSPPIMTATVLRISRCSGHLLARGTFRLRGPVPPSQCSGEMRRIGPCRTARCNGNDG